MEIKTNKLKQALANGEMQYGIWNGIADSYAAEVLAGSGFDWILIDAEHGPFDLRTIIFQLQAMSSFDVTPVVRPPSKNPVIIKQLLDAGVQSLLIPMVETGEEARELVKAIQYPPRGIRGVGTALARASQWNRIQNYFSEAEGQICLIVQVESVKGYDNLDKILEVEGIDGVFVGPADLAGSMGYLGEPMHAEVVSKVESAMQKIRNAGKAAGTIAVRDDIQARYRKAGANMIGLGVDLVILAKALEQLAKKYKTVNSE